MGMSSTILISALLPLPTRNPYSSEALMKSLWGERMPKLLTCLILSLAVTTVGGTACDSIDAAFDCQAVCSRYKECYNASFDVGQCRDTCRANAEADDAKRRRADACQACIDGRSCTGATFACTDECAGIIIAGS